MNVTSVETLHCDAGWRNYHFVKITTDDGVVGWSEFDEGFGAPGVSTIIERLAVRVVDQAVSDHERIFAELYCATRPAAARWPLPRLLRPSSSMPAAIPPSAATMMPSLCGIA